jgi:translation initiation factor 4B
MYIQCFVLNKIQCGEIESVRIARHPSGQSKGTGFVEFASEQAAEKGLALNGSQLGNRTLRVEFSNPNHKRRNTSELQTEDSADNKKKALGDVRKADFTPQKRFAAIVYCGAHVTYCLVVC